MTDIRVPEQKSVANVVSRLANTGNLVFHVCGFHMPVDGRVPLPLVHHPVANPILEAEFFHVRVTRVEMLVVEHARRHMHGVALFPVMARAPDF